MSELVVAGNQFDIGIALQSAKGVTIADANVQYRFPVTGGGLSASKIITPINETAIGRVRNTNMMGGISVDGAPQLVARPNVLGLLLFLLFGNQTVSGGADPYLHTFTLAAVQPYFTAWKRMGSATSGDYYEKYRDCKITGMTLASSAEGILIVTPTIMGLRVTDSLLPATAVAIDTGSVVFMHHHGDGAMLVDGVNVASISELSLALAADAEVVRGNSLYGYEVAEKMRNLVLDTTSLVDWALMKRYLYGNATPSDGDAPSSTVLELASGIDFKYTIPGSPARSFELIAPRVQTIIDPVNPNTDGAPLQMLAHHNVMQPTDGSTALTAKVQNGIATYPALSA